MEASPSPDNSGQRRGGHLKRLSLSVGAGSSSIQDMMKPSSTTSTPDRATQYASPSPRDSMSPLNRSLGSSTGRIRRQRPMSMYAGGASTSSPLSTAGGVHTSLLDATLSPSTSSTVASTSNAPSADQDQSLNAIAEDSSDVNNYSSNSISHPLAGTPTQDTFPSPSSSITSPSSSNPLKNSTGRRGILGRSAHARRQSSISYARSPSNDSSPSYANTSFGGTPRTSLSAIRDEDEDGNHHDTASPMAHQTPSRISIDRNRADSIDNQSVMSDTMSHQSLMGTSPSSINEMSVGPGARSSDLLTFIAKKERKCLDLREELQRQEAELAALKKKWEITIQREMQASTSPSSSSMSPSNSQTGGSAASSLFSSLTATLNASTSSSSLSSTHGTSATQGVKSPSPQGGASRRLLTNRHSISVASPFQSKSSTSGASPYFGGGADLSPQTSPLSLLNNAQQQTQSLDVQKLAKSWLGGVMKSASTVLEGLAPPPPTQNNDLHTVTEEEEPEEDDEEGQYERTSRNNQRTSAGHPSHSSRSPHNRKESTATNVTSTSEMSSPSSSCEDGQFSSGLASRSSSVSSLHSHNGKEKDDGERGDTTPIATPVLPYPGNNGTPRAASGNGEEERDLWGLSGDFEDDSSRDRREIMERSRIDIATGSPIKEMSPKVSAGPPTASRSANHGRRRSTAFEIGGAWGAMVGKKWNEMASSISANETLKASSKKAMGLMEDFERSLNEAITPDSNGADGNTHLMLVNGELIPTGDWSPPLHQTTSPRLQQQQGQSPSMNQRASDLPSGIGGPATWSALLGRTRSNDKPKSPQSDFDWTSNQEKSVSSFGNTSTSRQNRSLLDDDDNDESSDSLNVTSPISSRSSLSPTPLTAQERIQASRAKHAKRMSMPVNTLGSSSTGRRTPSPSSAKKDTFGLGLEGVNEQDEDEGAWGW